MENNSLVDKYAKILWDFNDMHTPLKKSDLIIGMGSHDIRIATYCAELYKKGYAPQILFAGNVGRLTREKFARPEADLFAEEAIRFGVPDKNILREDKSTNTGQNIEFAKRLLEEKGIVVNSVIMVHKPYMRLRAYGVINKQWPEVEVIATAPEITYEDYPNQYVNRENMINIMVGDIQRLMIYPSKGFMIPIEIPDEVNIAFHKLVELGYDKEMLPVIPDAA
jgi:uncharacterized SAM-binding protein YcdF (DUF218 family)